MVGLADGSVAQCPRVSGLPGQHPNTSVSSGCSTKQELIAAIALTSDPGPETPQT